MGERGMEMAQHGGAGMSSVSPQVSQRLEETSAALQDAVAQVEQLTVTNSRLGAGRGTHGGCRDGGRGGRLEPLLALTALPLQIWAP